MITIRVTDWLSRSVRPVRGQALIMFTLMLGTVFLGVTAAAVDISHQHALRRRLQNAADAGALAGAEVYRQERNASAAVAAAQKYVADNLPATGFGDVLDTPSGTGSSMVEGVEVVGDDVRVALRHNFEGIFSQAIGMPTLNVGARAKATILPPDAILPVVAKRFNKGRTDLALNDPLQPSPLTREDALCAGGGPISVWPNPPGTLMTGINCTAASASSPGPEIVLLGQGVTPNEPSQDNSFRAWVIPDIRNLHTGTPTYLAGVSGSVNSNKNYVEEYVRSAGGFTIDPSRPAPAVGDSLGAFTGTNAGLIVDAVDARHRPGDTVVAMVWDGTVFKAGTSDTSDRYVFILGYAMFRIQTVTSNSITARAVSGPEPTPSSFLRARRVALTAWN